MKNNKRILCVLLCICLTAVAGGCGSGKDSASADSRVENNQTGVGDVLQQGMENSKGDSGAAEDGTDGGTGTDDAGADSTAGTDGSVGAGTNGVTGTDGSAGADGSVGAGTNSVTGTDGVAGTDGTAGTDGVAGAGNASGADGSAGTGGAAGTNDATAADGTVGADSTAGTDGAAGAAALTPLDSFPENVDVDLTILPSNMVYSEVYTMMAAPSEYKGKVVRMSGVFSVYHDDTTGNDYFACINQDATACCSQGIEFVLNGNFSYPEDFPEVGSFIEVQGTFGSYMENDYEYFALMDAVVAKDEGTPVQ